MEATRDRCCDPYRDPHPKRAITHTITSRFWPRRNSLRTSNSGRFRPRPSEPKVREIKRGCRRGVGKSLSNVPDLNRFGRTYANLWFGEMETMAWSTPTMQTNQTIPRRVRRKDLAYSLRLSRQGVCWNVAEFVGCHISRIVLVSAGVSCCVGNLGQASESSRPHSSLAQAWNLPCVSPMTRRADRNVKWTRACPIATSRRLLACSFGNRTRAIEKPNTFMTVIMNLSSAISLTQRRRSWIISRCRSVMSALKTSSVKTSERDLVS